MTIIVPHNPSIGTMVEVRYHSTGLRLDDNTIIPSYGYGDQSCCVEVSAFFRGKFVGSHAGHAIIELEGGRRVAIQRSSITAVLGVA